LLRRVARASRFCAGFAFDEGAPRFPRRISNSKRASLLAVRGEGNARSGQPFKQPWSSAFGR